VSTPTGAPTSEPAGAPPSGLATDVDGHVWHAFSADRVLEAEHVDAQEGLSSAEVLARTQRFGPNKFDSGQAESRWHAFVRQYADPMQIVLLVAGVGTPRCCSRPSGWATASPRPASWSESHGGRTGRYSPGDS